MRYLQELENDEENIVPDNCECYRKERLAWKKSKFNLEYVNEPGF